MVIITPAYEFIKHLNILLPTAYLELVLHIYKRWIDSSVSVCYFTKLICIVFIYFSPISTPPHRGTSLVERSSSSPMWRGG